MSIRILAFSTTTELCSVALMVDQHIYYRDIITPKYHSEWILFMIDQLLSEVGITLSSLDYVIIDKGPGSFVGTRIGIGIAQGLTLGANLPLVEISSLVILAQGAWRVFGENQIITTLYARKGELYWAHYCRVADNNEWICEKNTERLVKEVFIWKFMSSLKGRWVLVGTGWDNYSILTCIKTGDSIVLRSIMFPQAQDMFFIGTYNWENKLFITPDQVKPVYLCDKVFIKI